MSATTWGTPPARWILFATVLSSGLVFLDATTVNVALPAIGADLDAELAGLQWTLNAYTLALAALMLLGGALADRFGRRRILLIGVSWFALASALCGLAPSVEVLALARGLQGIGGALLTPTSLAIIQASFSTGDRARAIGAWSALSGVGAALGPLVGGVLIDQLSWRWIFLINLPIAAFVALVAVRHVPESRDEAAVVGFDVAGAALAALGLGALTWALIEGGEVGGSATVWTAAVVGVVALATFVAVERRSRHPMLPPRLFASRQFSGANLVTLAVYAGLTGMMFLLVVHLQQVVGYSALAAGAALLPITGLMLALSARAGALASRIGPRRPMTLGPLVMATGLLLLVRVEAEASYVTTVLPAVVTLGLGLALTVAPLTATVLAAVEDRHSGVASGVNNAISRGAGLLAVALLPAVAGLSGDAYRDPVRFAAGFDTAMVAGAALVAAGGVLAWFTIRDESDAVPPVHCHSTGPPPLEASRGA